MSERLTPEPRTRNPEPSSHPSLRRILVVKLAGIGDLLTAFPAMEALRKCHPEAEISALVTPATAPMLEGAGLVDRVIVLDKYLFDDASGFLNPRALTGLWALAARLRAMHFDAAILLHHMVFWSGVVKYGFLMLATAARFRVGLDDGRARFLNLSVRDRGFGGRHEVEYWLEVVGLLGAIDPQPVVVRVRWGDAEDSYADEAWGGIGLLATDRVVAIHPGSGSYSPVRRWSPRGFAAVADSLASVGLKPLVVAGPDEEDLAASVLAAAQCRPLLLKAVPGPLHLAAILSRCRLFVGNDSGVTQIAFAAGVPVVALFGPSNRWAWAPYDPAGERSRVVSLDLGCSPCLYVGQSLGLRNGCGHPLCMLQITPDAVVAAAKELMAATESRPQ